jgi:predicted enzyme related to lactoylglutathione lyase
MAGEISFFELGLGDPDRARAFYGELFGWTFEPGPSDGGGFAITAPGTPGGVHGGDPGAGPYVFFRVDDMGTAVAKVRELGGTVDEQEPGGDDESAARFGRFRLCRDDQGSSFGLHEPPTAAA